MQNRILVPVDLENVDKLKKALDVSAKIASDSGATLVYAGVVDAVPTTTARTEGERAADRLRAFSEEQARAHGIKTTEHVALRGDLHLNVGPDVIKAAEEAKCDLIVMASHLPGLKEHFISSNAGYVAAHAPMSVYVVR
ncbi:universal stress protein [Marimonas sp. MJW-29]|uniref:Universal stress protein n=1 Tax=Sulfitobacter sediminis TaxID=3234186 RepID=A0ABV3RMY4_9RHOB